jgi:two-component system nitrate/nitrite response regulator NarL
MDEVVVSILSGNSESAPTQSQKLTPRETEVLRLLADGETVPSVAVQLELSESTVRTHVEHMRDKFGVSTQAALVALGFVRGYLS